MNRLYDILTIRQYLAGELDAQKSHQLERDALEDPMLQDAIDGLEHAEVLSSAKLSLLQQRLTTRVSQQQEKRNHFFFGRQRLAIASVAGVLFILACTLFWMINYPLKSTTQAPKEITLSAQSALHATLQSGNLIPLIGWEEYNHYLTINHSEPASIGKVKISFQVINARPSSIVVLEAENEALANDLVSLLKEGPDWEGSQGVLIFN